MKYILNSALFILYTFASMIVLGTAIMLPFPILHKEFDVYQIVLIYVLTIVIATTQSKCITYFREKLDF